MRTATRRVWGLVFRHLALYRRSWPRLLEIAYWPVLNLLIWGFTARFFATAHGVAGATPPVLAGIALIAGVLLWEITLRSQIGVTLTFMEEIWSRNLGHLFVSPLRPVELVLGLLTVSVGRTVVGLVAAALVAYLLYAFNLLALGPVVLLFFLNLLVMGWWIALAVVSLLFRYGAGAEALAWTVAFGITPFACVFYPASALPAPLRPVALALPAAHIFAGLRSLLLHHGPEWGQFAAALSLNALWLAIAALIFAAQFRAARVRGALISIGE